MPISEKEALEVLGYEDLSKVESADDFKTIVEKTWIKRDAAHNDKSVADKIFGKVNRGLRNELSGLNKALDLGIDDIDTKMPTEVIGSLSELIRPRLDKVKELEDKLKNTAPADVVSKFEADLKEKDKKINAFEKAAKDTQSKYDELFTSVQAKEKSSKVNGEWEGALKSIPFASTVDELRKEGFIAKSKAKYQVLIDDEGKTYAANDKGEPLMNPKKAAERWTLADALKAEADALKLIGVNPQGGRQVTPPARTKEVPEPAGRFGLGARRPAAHRLQ
jgi:hypothetical protein